MLTPQLDTDAFAAGPSLKVVSTISVGFGKMIYCLLFSAPYKCSVEHVDLQALYRRKVRLGYTPDVLTDAGENKSPARLKHQLKPKFIPQKWQIRP
jgi:glyoxylate/hydroxypyruvate reductase